MFIRVNSRPIDFRRDRAPSLCFGISERSRSPDLHQPIVCSLVLDRNLYITLVGKTLKLFSPLDQQDAVRVHQIVERQGIELTLGINAIEIDVIERDIRPTVLVDESKGRAGYVFGFGSVKAFSDAFHYRGLPCS